MKELKNTGGASRDKHIQNVMKKYVKFIVSSFLTLCSKYNGNFSGSFAKDAKIKILNVETFPVAAAAMG